MAEPVNCVHCGENVIEMRVGSPPHDAWMPRNMDPWCEDENGETVLHQVGVAVETPVPIKAIEGEEGPDTVCLACHRPLTWMYAGRRQERIVWLDDGRTLRDVCSGDSHDGHVPASDPRLVSAWLDAGPW